MTFELDARIDADSILLGRLPLSQVRLHRDGRYPWIMLVPQRDVREIHELSRSDRAQLMEESCAVSAAMQEELNATKMNVAALGNMVPQLHVHHVARFETDDAWPGAIWGAHPARHYENDALLAMCERMQKAFAAIDGFTAAK